MSFYLGGGGGIAAATLAVPPLAAIDGINVSVGDEMGFCAPVTPALSLKITPHVNRPANTLCVLMRYY